MIEWLKSHYTFPITSDLYWLIGSVLFLAWFWAGELAWIFGVKNFDAYTWWIRETIPRPWLIGITIGFAAFIVWHFAYGKGVGPLNQ